MGICSDTFRRSALNIVFLTPTHPSTARGNTVTVQRWCAGLWARGHQVKVLENGDLDQLKATPPQILHAHHAVHCGPAAAAFVRQHPQVRLVISLGGTDLHGPDGSPQAAGRDALSRAHAIVAPFAADGEKLRRCFPECTSFFVVPRGVALRSSGPHALSPPLRGLVLGGIRPVKGQLDAVAWQEALGQAGMDLVLEFAGPTIDPEYGTRLIRACSRKATLNYLGVLDPRATANVLEDCDFLLNSSLSEGASNAILEALASGRPVTARDVPGNRQMLENAPPSIAHLLRPDAVGLVSWQHWLKGLLRADPDHLAQKAQSFVAQHHDPEKEIDALLNVYHQILC